MNDLIHASLQRALEITIEMMDAATSDNWAYVVQLDAQRQVYLDQVSAGTTGPEHRETLLALQAHNHAVLERANLAHQQIEQQLGQHQYNHRALRTYITSSSSR
jgi:hypothetical protein